jgi:hypothetical protein
MLHPFRFDVASSARAFAVASGLSLTIFAGQSVKAAEELPIVYQTDFEKGADDWKPTDAKTWKIEQTDGDAAYHQTAKQSDYKPPHRSPYNISLLQGHVVGSFQLDAQVKSTHPDYGHRDACLFFGWQGPAKFYYVHLGKAMDDHANQIFVVDSADRTKISTKTTDGTPWNDEWHHVRITRDAKSGEIAVYFDDMENPAMTAKDDRFAWGQIGLGSFDDTTAWDDVTLRGEKVEKTAEATK